MNIGKTMCRIIWKDDFFPETEGYSIPSDGLLAIASVAGFELEGYVVTRPDAAEEIAPLEENDLFRQIVEREGVKNQAEADWPGFDLTDWQTLCRDVCESGKPVLLYLKKTPVMAFIQKADEQGVLLDEFQEDGNWRGKMYRIPYEEMERMVIGDRVTRLTAKYLDRRLAPAELTEAGNTPAETLRAGMRQKVLCDVESSGFIRQVYPVAVTRNLYVAACAEDFLLDGYEIGATSALKNVCLRPDYTDAVYREEGLKAQLAAPLLPMRGWREMLEALKAQRRFVEISRTEADCREEFYFGRIRETTERAVTLDIFDELGGWTDEPLRIPYEKIGTVAFGMRTLELLGRYAGEAE